jgi:uncharacterized membrane protein
MQTVQACELAAGEDRPSDLHPRWPWIAGTTLSAIGLGLAAYLAYEHYTSSTTLNCPAGGGIVDCLKVTTSRYATIHGLPVVILGLAFFGVMMGLQNRRAWVSTSSALRAGRVLWSLAGVGTALWLIYAELFKLGAVCLWCTAVHIVSMLLFGLTAFGTAATGNLAMAAADD